MTGRTHCTIVFVGGGERSWRPCLGLWASILTVCKEHLYLLYEADLKEWQPALVLLSKNENLLRDVEYPGAAMRTERGLARR